MAAVVDVVVVGNGALGHAVARALRALEPTAKVALVGPAARAFGASPAAGAMLGCFGEVTARLLRSPVGGAKLRLAVRAARLWPEWAASLDGVAIQSGTFVIE